MQAQGHEGCYLAAKYDFYPRSPAGLAGRKLAPNRKQAEAEAQRSPSTRELGPVQLCLHVSPAPTLLQQKHGRVTWWHGLNAG